MTDDLLGGRYRRHSSLGVGAMGEVWLAEDIVLGRAVAIKRLRTDPDVGSDSNAVERMVREARVAARLHHPNAVAVFDLVREDGQPYVVMEYVRGESLADRLRRVGILEPGEAARIVAQIARALAAANRAAIVHRDVKPANILIDDDGNAKLADFGIARGVGDTALTDTGQMIGTIAYMAPEVARTGEASAASDVWSLGATLYACVEGRAPYGVSDLKTGTGRQSAATMLIRLVTEPVPMPKNAGGLTPILVRMLAAEPSQRPTPDEIEWLLSEAGYGSEAVGRSAPATPSAETGPSGYPADAGDGEPTYLRTNLQPLPRAEGRASADQPAVEAPTVSAEYQPAPDTDGNPVDSLNRAIEAMNRRTEGWSGEVVDWEDLIHDAVQPALHFGDQIDLFIPTLFGIDRDDAAGVPRRVARSLRSMRAGATITCADRVLFAWNESAWGTNHFCVTVSYQEIHEVDVTEYEDGGEDFAGLEIVTSRFRWPVLFSNQYDLTPWVGALRRRLDPGPWQT